MELITLKDFLETYLSSNVLLLADVLSIFRKTMMENFRLDPMQYFSLSGYSFDCALRHTEKKLERFLKKTFFGWGEEEGVVGGG